jgi:recombinational DNA repair protein (RecF pathway)
MNQQKIQDLAILLIKKPYRSQSEIAIFWVQNFAKVAMLYYIKPSYIAHSLSPFILYEISFIYRPNSLSRLLSFENRQTFEINEKCILKYLKLQALLVKTVNKLLENNKFVFKKYLELLETKLDPRLVNSIECYLCHFKILLIRNLGYDIEDLDYNQAKLTKSSEIINKINGSIHLLTHTEISELNIILDNILC